MSEQDIPATIGREPEILLNEYNNYKCSPNKKYKMPQTEDI